MTKEAELLSNRTLNTSYQKVGNMPLAPIHSRCIPSTTDNDGGVNTTTINPHFQKTFHRVTMSTVLFVVFVLFSSSTTATYHHFQQKLRNIQCHCVPAHLCPDEEVAANGHGLLDPRVIRGRCSDPDEICCDSAPPEEAFSEPPKSRCGASTVPVKSRIMSGTTTTFGELPWNLIVQEVVGDKERNLYKCGASLIHPKVAITAAHCVAPFAEQPERVMVRAGEWDVDSRDEPLPFQDNFVEEILIHHGYSALSLKNDVAILVLSEEFRLADNVGVMCLSSPSERIIENKCLASGWGKNAHRNGSYSSVLKKVELPIVSRNHCLNMLRSTRLGPRYNLHKSFICAGGRKDRDSCKGDGGSPLICPLLDDPGRYVQVGIVSWGIGCGSNGIPGVYVNVPLYLDWIEQEMNDRNLDTGSFRL